MRIVRRNESEDAALSVVDGSFDEAPRERLLRESFLLGFVVLLFLVLALGTVSWLRLTRVEEEVVASSQNAQRNQAVVLTLSKQAARLGAEVRNLQLARAFGAPTFPARNRIREIEREVTKALDQGRSSAMAAWPEWAEVEREFAAYRAALETLASAPTADVAPTVPSAGFERAVEGVLTRVTADLEAAEATARRIRRAGQRDILLATAACVGVGLFVSIASFVETRRRITMIRAAYRRVAQSKELMESTIEGMSNAVLTLGVDGRVSRINGEALELLEVDSASDVVGRPVEDALAGHPRLLAVVAPVVGAAEHDRRYLGRVETGANGRLFDVYAAPLVMEGEVRGFIVNLADVTEAERAAQELRRNRALMAIGTMTAQVAHEIKNPLGGVRLSAQMLERMHPNDERSLEVVRRIQSSVDHLARIVAELNQFARPRELSLEPIRLDRLLDELLQAVGDRVEGKRIRVVRRYDGAVPEAYFDEGELRKALINFLLNALEASREGGLVEVAVEPADGPGEMARVVIRDEGHGMDDETKRRLFEPFYTTKASGTGLGMSIAQKIVELHGGRLEVRSAVGEGTTVVVTLPLTLVPAAEPAARE